MVQMCNMLMTQIKQNPQPPKPVLFQQEKKQIKQPLPVKIPALPGEQLPADVKLQLQDLKNLIDNDDLQEDFDALIPRLNTYFNSKDQYAVLLDLKVPVNFNYLIDIMDTPLDKFIRIVDVMNTSSRSMLWQEASLYQLQSKNKSIQYLELDDAFQFQRLLKFKAKAKEILSCIDKGATLYLLQPLLVNAFNNVVLENYQQLLDQDVISWKHLLENVLFFNSSANELFLSENYKPLLFMDESRVQSNIVFIDKTQPIKFNLFEKKLYNLSIFQKHKFVKKQNIEVDNTVNQPTSYKFKHPIRIKKIDGKDVLNRQYINAFANGHENTSTRGINPYNFDLFETDVEKQFEKFEDCNQLEEHLMRYDVYINNLKHTQLLLTQFVANQENHLQLPLNCQVLLKAAISEEYFQQLQLYPQIAAPIVLERIDTCLLEIMKFRELVVAPLFAKRVAQIYFNQMDSKSINLIENDKKLASCKQFVSELQTKKSTAGVLHKDQIVQQLGCGAQLKNGDPLPWDYEINNLPLAYVKNQISVGKTPAYYQSLVQKCKAAGCCTTYHDNDAKIDYDDGEIELFEEELSKFRSQGDVYIKAFSYYSMQQNQSQFTKQLNNKQHFCSNIPHVMIPINQILACKEAQEFVKAVVCGDDLEKLNIFEMVLKLIEGENITVIDPSIYILVRFLVIVLDRTTQLFQVSNSWTTTNAKFAIFNRLEMKKSEPSCCFDQFAMKRQLTSEIDDLAQTIEYPQYSENSWDIMKMLLMSPKTSAEYDIMSIFGPNAYLAKNFKQQIRTLKRLFDDLCYGYSGFMELINGQAQLQQIMTPECFAGFLLRLQIEQNVKLIIPNEKKTFLIIEADTMFRQANVFFGQQAIVVEQVDGVLCFSEIDF